jgi:hypothetical protein
VRKQVSHNSSLWVKSRCHSCKASKQQATQWTSTPFPVAHLWPPCYICWLGSWPIPMPPGASSLY